MSAGHSRSVVVRVIELEISAARLVSVRLRTSAERTAASLVPAMLMVTEVSVPSAEDRKSVVEGERVALGGRRIVKEKKVQEEGRPMAKRPKGCRLEGW